MIDKITGKRRVYCYNVLIKQILRRCDHLQGKLNQHFSVLHFLPGAVSAHRLRDQTFCRLIKYSLAAGSQLNVRVTHISGKVSCSYFLIPCARQFQEYLFLVMREYTIAKSLLL
jgi:hypothetical protein